MWYPTMKRQIRETLYDLTGIYRKYPAPALFGMTSDQLFAHLVTQYVAFRKMNFMAPARPLGDSQTVMSNLMHDDKIPHISMLLRDNVVQSAYRGYIISLYRQLDALFIGDTSVSAIPLPFISDYEHAVRFRRLKVLGPIATLCFTLRKD